MKKRWILVLALVVSLTLTAGCGGKKEVETKDTQEETAEENEEYKSKVVKLGNYKGVKAEAVSTEVTEEEIQAEIDALLAFYPDTQSVEGKTIVEDGDTVHIDFVGKLDGVPFEGGDSQGAGYDLTIGSHSFISGFEEGLIGKEIGNTYDLNLTFPDTYKNNPDLAGKDVVFTVTVHEIIEYVDAEWTDEFVQKYTEYDSIDAYMEGTRATLEEEKVRNQPSEWEYRVIQAVIEDSEFDCDEEELESLTTNITQEYEMYASLYGMEMADFLQYYMNGLSEEEFRQQARERAEFQLKNQLVVDAISAAEKISLTEEEYQEGLKGLAEQYGAESPEAFEEQYGRETVEAGIIYDKTIDFVVGQAVEI